MRGNFLVIKDWLPLAEAVAIADPIQGITNWKAKASGEYEDPAMVDCPNASGFQRIKRSGEPPHSYFVRPIKNSDPLFCSHIESRLIELIGDDLALMDDIHASMFQAGSYISTHYDNGHRRRVAFAFYLARDWDPEWGGCLTISKAGKWHRIPPRFNSLVLIDTQAETPHFVSRVCADVSSRRIAIAGWLGPSSIESICDLDPAIRASNSSATQV